MWKFSKITLTKLPRATILALPFAMYAFKPPQNLCCNYTIAILVMGVFLPPCDYHEIQPITCELVVDLYNVGISMKNNPIDMHGNPLKIQSNRRAPRA